MQDEEFCICDLYKVKQDSTIDKTDTIARFDESLLFCLQHAGIISVSKGQIKERKTQENSNTFECLNYGD